MAIPYIALDPQRRQQLRIASSVLQFVLCACFFVTFVSEFFIHLISIKYGIRALLADRLVYLINKSVVVIILSVPLFVLHVYQIQLLLKQTERRSQLSFKQLTEFMMLSATALAFVLLMFMFSLSYAGRFRRALTETLADRLIFSNSTERDKIHNDFFCCGVYGYRDYMPENEKETESPILRLDTSVPPFYCKRAYHQSKRMCVAPPSCCLQTQCSTLIPYYTGGLEATSQWYRKTGCLESITRSFKHQLSSTPITIFLFVVFLLEIASVVLLQFTLSSFTLLKEANLDQTSGSFGWLLSIGYPSPMELLTEIAASGQNEDQMGLEERVVDAATIQNNQEKEETKKSVMTELNKSLKSGVPQVG